MRTHYRMADYLALLTVLLIAVGISYSRATASNRRCGLPPFVDDLPENEKKEIISVWKDYKQGDECVDERQETQEIIDNLPSDVRNLVFGRPPQFLKDASQDVKKMFHNIMHNDSLSRTQKEDEMRRLGEQVLNKKQQKQLKNYLEEREKQRNEFEEKVKNLSPAAKEAFDKLEALKRERLDLIKSMSDEVRVELRNLYRIPKSRRRQHY